MTAGGKKQYTYGKRFDRMRLLALFLYECLVFVFYFIYRYLFKAEGSLLVILFVGIAIVVAFLTFKIGDKLKHTLRYEVGEDGLKVVNGTKETVYDWSAFSEAQTKGLNLLDRYPVYFTVNNKRLELSQYVDHVSELGYDIMCHMPEHATVSDSFRTLTESMRGIGI